MTDKERLKEIKEFVKHADGDLTAQLFGFDIRPEAIVDDFNWLIEQSERVNTLNEQLETALKAKDQAISYNATLENQIHELEKSANVARNIALLEINKKRRYEHTLEFYANPKTYITQGDNALSEITMDYGEKARQILEENKNEYIRRLEKENEQLKHASEEKE